MLTAVHSDNASEYRPLLKQLLLAQPEHRVHAAGQAPHGLGRVSDRQQRGAGHADARRAASGDPGNLHVHDIGLTMTTDPPTRAASRATCSARNFEDTPMKDSSDIATIISAQNP